MYSPSSHPIPPNLFKVPVILGGHEHTVFEETSGDSLIVKAGQDAVNIAIVDVWWTDSGATCLLGFGMWFAFAVCRACLQSVDHTNCGKVKSRHSLIPAKDFPSEDKAEAWTKERKDFVIKAMEARSELLTRCRPLPAWTSCIQLSCSECPGVHHRLTLRDVQPQRPVRAVRAGRISPPKVQTRCLPQNSRRKTHFRKLATLYVRPRFASARGGDRRNEWRRHARQAVLQARKFHVGRSLQRVGFR